MRWVLNKKSFLKAVYNTNGRKTDIAKYLGISPPAVSQFLKKYPDYERFIDLRAEQLKERYEDTILGALEIEREKVLYNRELGTNTLNTTKWWLERKHKDYMNKQEVEHNGIFNINHTNLTEQEKQDLLEDLSNKQN